MADERELSLSGHLSSLSLRTKPIAGKISDRVKIDRPIIDIGGVNLLLLVHGFNNNQPAAKASYKKFMDNIEVNRNMHVAQLYWPGDAHRSELVSAFGYSLMISRAVECASKLASFLLELLQRPNGTVNIYIAAHSLGCRLTLEFIHRLEDELKAHIAERGNIRPYNIKLVALMAAAVPVHMIRKGARLDLLKMSGQPVRIVFSKKDNVLALAFRPGQAFVFSDWGRPFANHGALGLHGLPRNFPNQDRITDERVAVGHSGYWPNRSLARSLAADLPQKTRTVPHRSIGQGRVLA